VGFLAVGTPLPLGRSAVGVLDFSTFFLAFLAFLAFCGVAFFWAPPCEDCCWPVLVPAGSGVLDVPVFVVLVDVDDEEDPDPLCEGEVEVEVECVGELEAVDELGGAAVVVVVVLVVTATEGVVVVEGAHCSFSETITP
jgi:hypothetical protein